MIAAAVIVLFVASSTAAPVEPWWGQPAKPEFMCGGSQVDQQYSYLPDFNEWGLVKKIEVWVNNGFIHAVRFTHGDAPEGPRIGGPGGLQVGNVVLGEGEFVTGVNMEKQPMAIGDAICRLGFITNRQTIGPYGGCTHVGDCGTRSFTAPMQYARISYGIDIYALSFFY